MAARVGCGRVAEDDSTTVFDVTSRGAVFSADGNANRREFLSKLAVGESLGAAMTAQFGGVVAVSRQRLLEENWTSLSVVKLPA